MNVRATTAQAAISGPDNANGEAHPERATASQAIHPVPEHERSAGDTEVEDRTRNARPLSAAAEIGTDNGGDRGRGEKPGRAQRLRNEQRPGDFSRDVHDWRIYLRLRSASMSQRKGAEAQRSDSFEGGTATQSRRQKHKGRRFRVGPSPKPNFSASLRPLR